MLDQSRVLQLMVNDLSRAEMEKRALTQMTLGQMISDLEALPADAEVDNLCDAHSYRGYYSDLCFHREPGKRKASELLQECRNAMGNVFEGYKGGDFVMHKNTPVWIGCYGVGSGQKIVGLLPDGTFETQDEDE